MPIDPLQRIFVLILLSSPPFWLLLGLYLLARFGGASLRPFIPWLRGISIAMGAVVISYPIFTNSFKYSGILSGNCLGFLFVLNWVRRRFDDRPKSDGYWPGKNSLL
jgi:hypothetical protein